MHCFRGWAPAQSCYGNGEFFREQLAVACPSEDHHVDLQWTDTLFCTIDTNLLSCFQNVLPYLAKVNSSLISTWGSKTWVDFVDTTRDWTFWKRHLYLVVQGPLKLRIAGKNDSDRCTAFLKLWEFYWKHMHFFSKKEEGNKVYPYYP